MKNDFSYFDIVNELCQGCRPASHPGSRLDPCKWCDVTFATERIWHALKESTLTRRRVPFFSDPRDNVPPAGYVVMAVYDNAVGIISERQYKRALKNAYVNQACGIWYNTGFPVFVQRPDGSLYRPHAFEHDN
ncbi:MAG: hypothetical protein ACI3XQ_13445 [Eubacteriales bacterium]